MPRCTFLVAMLAALVLAACGDHGHGDGGDHGHDHDGGHGHDREHDHNGVGPNGGEIVPIGADDVAHLEVAVDHGRLAVIVHVLTTANKPLPIRDAPTLEVTLGGARKTLTGKAVDEGDAGASQWHFRDAALEHEPEDGVFTVTIAGTAHRVALAHDEHDHGAAHDGHGDAHDGDEGSGHDDK